MVGMVHSLESFGSSDGPGVRFIVFLQGCAMRCAYCHNPDTWRCGGGTPMTVDEILDKAERYRSYWGSEGGITVSGGEALLQAEFVAELFEAAHARNINTCLDTALQPFDAQNPTFMAAFDRILAACDVVMADIKHIRADAHKNLTGHENANILQALLYMANKGNRLWIRYVLVPGVTDDVEDLAAAGDFIGKLSTVERVEVLPYHTLGIYKWDELGLNYRLRDVDPPTQQAQVLAQQLLEGGHAALEIR